MHPLTVGEKTDCDSSVALDLFAGLHPLNLLTFAVSFFPAWFCAVSHMQGGYLIKEHSAVCLFQSCMNNTTIMHSKQLMPDC